MTLATSARHAVRRLCGLRLFWKILFGFWLTFLLIVEGLWLYMTLSDDGRRPGENYYMESSAPAHLASLVWVVQNNGLTAAQTLLAQWPERDRAMVSIAMDGGHEQSKQGLPTLTRFVDAQATAPDGTSYTLRHRLPDQPRPPRPAPLPWNIPVEILVVGVVGGLPFAAILAWYLIRPIQTLRQGFGRLSGGELSVRVQPTMGRRRDELADLAQSFDRMADHLERLVLARDQLLHDVSHELRSPLARLHMAVGLARQSPARLEASLDRIEAEGRRLDDMVGELLSLARAEAGAQEQEQYFAIYDLIRSVLADAAFEAQTSQITAQALLREQDGPDADDGPILAGNARLIHRALDNVVRNALRFSPAGGEITVTATPDLHQHSLIITIEDDGPGVAPQDLPHLFSPFVRGINNALLADHDQSKDGGGFGLGLAIARRTIEAHHGTISAYNRPCTGLAVRITLPLRGML